MSPFQNLLQEALPLMAVQPRDRILQVACGDGWACRLLAPLLSEGLVIGLDPSDDAIREARVKSLAFENILYIWSDLHRIPWQEDFFTQALAVDVAGSLQGQQAIVGELFRVLSPGGVLWLFGTAELQEVAEKSDPRSGKQCLENDPYPAMLLRCGFESPELHLLPNSLPAQSEMPAAWLLSARKSQR